MLALTFAHSSFPSAEGVVAWLACRIGEQRAALGPLATPGAYSIADARGCWLVRRVADIAGKPDYAVDGKRIDTDTVVDPVELEQGVTAWAGVK